MCMGEQHNTPELWNRLWANEASRELNVRTVAKEEAGIRWQRIEDVVAKTFGGFTGLNVIEIGAGSGTNGALAAKRGARVTVLDYSEKALERARDLFTANGLSARFERQDALALPEELLGTYDISMSFGLTEHFSGDRRMSINKAHFDLLKEGGVAFIAVPHKYNPPYRIFKFLAERLGQWGVGEEYPYSRKEFKELCACMGVEEYSFFGDSLVASLNFLNPMKIVRKVFHLKRKIRWIRKEKGTFLDEYLSYSLVLCGKK